MGDKDSMIPDPHDETVFQILLSGAAAFLMALLRSLRFTHTNLIETFAEALMCGLISAAIVPILWSYFELSIYKASFIGAVVGMSGVNLLYIGLLSFLPSRIVEHLPHGYDITHSNKPTSLKKHEDSNHDDSER